MLRCGLPFLKVGEPQSSQFDHVTRDDWVVRRYSYPIKLDAPPATDFAGEVVISHPDDPSRLLPIRVVGEESLPFRVTPRHLRLRARGDRLGRLFVKPAVSGSKITVVTGQGDARSMVIRPISPQDDALLMFDVSPGPAPIPGDDIVVSMDGRPDRVVVSVEIESGGQP